VKIGGGAVMPEFGGCEWLFYLLFLLALAGVFLLGVRLASWCWRKGIPIKREVVIAYKCEACGCVYTDDDIDGTLKAMGFGPGGDPVDEDYLVLIDGLCPDCWPEYN